MTLTVKLILHCQENILYPGAWTDYSMLWYLRWLQLPSSLPISFVWEFLIFGPSKHFSYNMQTTKCHDNNNITILTLLTMQYLYFTYSSLFEGLCMAGITCSNLPWRVEWSNFSSALIDIHDTITVIIGQQFYLHIVSWWQVKINVLKQC